MDEILVSAVVGNDVIAHVANIGYRFGITSYGNI